MIKLKGKKIPALIVGGLLFGAISGAFLKSGIFPKQTHLVDLELKESALRAINARMQIIQSYEKAPVLGGAWKTVIHSVAQFNMKLIEIPANQQQHIALPMLPTIVAEVVGPTIDILTWCRLMTEISKVQFHSINIRSEFDATVVISLSGRKQS